MSRVQTREWMNPAMVALLAFALGSFAATVPAQQRDEREVRSAYVFNLIKYLDWPGDRRELCIIYAGDPGTGEVMQKMLDGKTIASQVIHVVQQPSDDQLERCVVAYFGDAKPEEMRKGLERLHGKSILTVGETEAFARDGGMIGLVKMNDSIQIQVNLEATHQAGLRISSRVLDLAVIVRPAQNARN